MEVVKIITNSRFSRIKVATSATEPPDSDETFAGSTLPLIMACIRSSGDTLIELLDDSMLFTKTHKPVSSYYYSSSSRRKKDLSLLLACCMVGGRRQREK
jgi:hypothetical protein